MIKSLPLFIALSSFAILSMVRIEVASSDQQSDEVNPGEEDYWSKYQPKPENDPFSLSCLLFYDAGCDAECFIVTDAFGKLGGGACDKNNVCVCNYAENPTLEGLWKERFDASEEILQYIEADSERFGMVHVILVEPFRTGLQMKEKLKKYLTETQYEGLRVTDTCPAMNMNSKPDKRNLKTIEKYVDKVLASKELKSDIEELAAFNLETSLHLALEEYKSDVQKFNLLVFEIRRVQNKSMDVILNNYLTSNNIQEPSADKKGSNEDGDDKDGNEGNKENAVPNNNKKVDEVDVVEIISKTIVNKLITKMEKSGFENFVNWLGKTFTSIFTSCTSPTAKYDYDVPSEDSVYHSEFFKTPPLVDRKPFKKPDKLNKTWMEKTFKLRYRKDKQNNIILNWIKKPVLVSIRKTSESNVNHNWVFGTKVRINMTWAVGGSIFQTWDFGTKTYQYYNIKDANGSQHSDEKWSDGTADEESLDTYKSYMRTWCNENRFLVDYTACVIFNYKSNFR